MQTVEERLDNLERSVRRWRLGGLVLGLTLVAAVTMGQRSGDALPGEDKVADEIRCRKLVVVDEEGNSVVFLESVHGAGVVGTLSSKGNILFAVGGSKDGDGMLLVNAADGKPGVGIIGRTPDDTGGSILVYNKTGKPIVIFKADEYGNGIMGTFSSQGKDMVQIGATEDGKGKVLVGADKKSGVVIWGMAPDDTGGAIAVYNKTGEPIVNLVADEYGNGMVGAWNRKGMGRTLKPGQ